MHCTDSQLWWPNKMIDLKKERLLILVDNHFFSSSMNHETFIMLCVAFLLNMTVNFNLFAFLCLVQFCNFYFCTLEQIN